MIQHNSASLRQLAGLSFLLISMWSSVALCKDVRDARPDDARARGYALAKAHCAECHAIEADDPTPTAVNANTSFKRLAERFPIPMLEEASRSGSISGHDEMPGFDFTMENIRDLLSYIDSFAPTDKRYLSLQRQGGGV